MRRTWAWLAIAGLLAGLLLGSQAAVAQSAPITRFVRHIGNMNFVATGGSLRSQSNNGNACAVNATSTANVIGVPGGATIVAAYLYWGGSGGTVDANVTLNGSGVAASRTFTTVFNNGGTNFPFFGGFADVTSRVSGNGSFTFGGLTVATGAPHCGSEAVLSGWGLVVIYSLPTEPLRAINVFDGLEYFRGSAVTLFPDGFRVPAAPIDGRIAVVSWEGDPGNSTPLGGFSESLTFNGATLDDGVNVAGSNPLVQPYDGTVNTLGVATSYGVDVDTFTVDPFISQGQTSATTVYSAGGDLVLLTAQIVSVTSEPFVDLGITMTHSGDLVAGTPSTYTIQVSNGTGVGLEPEDNPIVVTDTLPAGVSFVSGTGTGWSCSAASQVVTCTHPPTLGLGATLPDLTLTVLASGSAAANVVNTATVSSASAEGNPTNNTANDPTIVRFPNLSTSTKSVQDLNGGDADPGDTLRYTITLQETAGFVAPGVRVTDDIPANTTGFVVTTVPAGAINSSTGAGTGTNGAGFLDVDNITVPANGSVTVVFEVQVAGGAAVGSTIDNTAQVLNAFGPGATPSAPQLIVSQSQIPGSGGKPLYVHSAPQQLSRTPAAGGAAITIDGNDDQETWTLAPALATNLSLPAQNVPVQLYVTRSNNNAGVRNVTVRLLVSGVGVIGTASQNLTGLSATNPGLRTFVVPIAARTVPAGATISLQVENTTNQANRAIRIHPVDGPDRSNVGLTSNTVISVQSVATYDAAYPGGAATPSVAPGSTVFMRAVVSDPFGSFDITGANITLLDPNGATVLNNVAMTQQSPDPTPATRIYELSFNVPAAGPAGAWTMRVTAREGTENTVTDLGVGSFSVVLPQPTLVVAKSVQVISDPFNNVTNPKRIPGSVQLYSIVVTNQGPGTVDASSLTLADRAPPNSTLYVSTASGDPVAFIDGTPASGLSFNYAANVSYSNQPGGGAPYSYTPVPDADGYDPNVTGLRIAPTGTMNAAGGAGNPSFTIRFRVRVN
jgi:uncharacterized repeat protein (TIGR01451 family)